MWKMVVMLLEQTNTSGKHGHHKTVELVCNKISVCHATLELMFHCNS